MRSLGGKCELKNNKDKAPKNASIEEEAKEGKPTKKPPKNKHKKNPNNPEKWKQNQEYKAVQSKREQCHKMEKTANNIKYC